MVLRVLVDIVFRVHEMQKSNHGERKGEIYDLQLLA